MLCVSVSCSCGCVAAPVVVAVAVYLRLWLWLWLCVCACGCGCGCVSAPVVVAVAVAVPRVRAPSHDHVQLPQRAGQEERWQPTRAIAGRAELCCVPAARLFARFCLFAGRSVVGIVRVRAGARAATFSECLPLCALRCCTLAGAAAITHACATVLVPPSR